MKYRLLTIVVIKHCCILICLRYGRIPSYIRRINGCEPAPLDVLEVPLSQTGPHFGFANDNRLILLGAWHQIEKFQATDLMKYTRYHNYHILHNTNKYVTVPYLQAQAIDKRYTLQLVYTDKLVVNNTVNDKGVNLWRGTIFGINQQLLSEASITDPLFIEKLDAGYRPHNPCLVTVSLSMPYRPDNWEGEDPCWKLIASVIELP